MLVLQTMCWPMFDRLASPGLVDDQALAAFCASLLGEASPRTQLLAHALGVLRRLP